MANSTKDGKSEKLSRALKSSEPVVQHYVAKLEAANAKSEEIIADLELKNISKQNRIKALEKERKTTEPPTDTDIVDIARRVKFLLAKAEHIDTSSGKTV